MDTSIRSHFILISFIMYTTFIMEGQSEWTLFSSKFLRMALVFLCQVIILYISIITCFVNLTVCNGPNELWITVLSLSLGTILPSPKVRKTEIGGGSRSSSISSELPTHSFPQCLNKIKPKKKSINPKQNVKSAWERYLEKIYFDPSHPGSFNRANKLHEAIKDEGKYTIPLIKVKRWLKNQESFSLHKPLCRAFHCLKVIIGGLNDQYEADLADMQKLKDKHDGVCFLLVIIDVFSRFMWVEPLENKLEDTVINTF